MPFEDRRGVLLSGSSDGALDLFETALDDVLSFHGDPIGAADAALERDPGLVSAALLKAHVLTFSLHPGFMKKAAGCLTAATELSMNPREQLHAAAIRAWLDGEIAQARAGFDTILETWPRDLMALMFAHQADFFGADEDALLHRPTNALAAWPDDLAGRGYVLAMRAFGLEEAGRLAEAEAAAREALAANPRDAWALHAVAHVLEMQGRDTEGIAWYAERRADWAEDCFFAVHNWWHWALYHVDRDEPAAALALYDEGLAPDPRAITLNLCDAASLLWRLQLAGHPVGERFAALADAFDAPASRPIHVFNDVHAMLAFVGAGRLDRAAAHLAMLEAAAGGSRAAWRNAAPAGRSGQPRAAGVRPGSVGGSFTCARAGDAGRAADDRQPGAARCARDDADRGRLARRRAAECAPLAAAEGRRQARKRAHRTRPGALRLRAGPRTV